MAIFLAYLVPPSILFIPLAAVVFKMGLFDTRWALILTYPTFFQLTIFPDGRAIIKGTDDITVARSLYARYVGT